MDGYMTHGRFELSGTGTLSASNWRGPRRERRRQAAGHDGEGRSETLDIDGIFDMGNRDLNRRWVSSP